MCEKRLSEHFSSIFLLSNIFLDDFTLFFEVPGAQKVIVATKFKAET